MMSNGAPEYEKNAPAPVAVVMISLNEAHNMEAVLANLAGFASEVILVDSFSSDETVDIALEHGTKVIQRRFTGFGDQWNFAMQIPVAAPWTMKLDPDERLTDQLKESIRSLIASGAADAAMVHRRLWFMGRPLPVKQTILRLWRTGTCRFSDVLVNEHPIVARPTTVLSGDLEHHDSPNLHHWLEKQNAYTTAEALAAVRGDALSQAPRLLGSSLERRMWFKHNYARLPFRFLAMHLYCLLVQGAWRAGYVGFVWARLRADVYRLQAYKLKEMRTTGKAYAPTRPPSAPAHRGVEQAGDEWTFQSKAER